MQDRPTNIELLKTVGDFIEQELMPNLAGPLQYRSRVALNLLRILEREAQYTTNHLQRERDLLARLLVQGGEGLDNLSLADEVAELNRRLVERIDAGATKDPAHQQEIWGALMQIAIDKLAVCRPGYADYDAVREVR